MSYGIRFMKWVKEGIVPASLGICPELTAVSNEQGRENMSLYGGR